MLYIKPDYYHKFQCTADRCEATCCAGWQIVVDEEALKRYESEAGAYGEILRKRIDWNEGVFLQDHQKRCAFLKENNLCEMYEQLGEESLCFTCANYPRHIEAFENIREITLAISCPEVARIILERKDAVRFVEEEVEGEEEEMEEFDPFFFSYLEDARAIMLAVLQNRSLSIEVRAALIQQMADEMQEIVDEGELFDLADVFETYEEEDTLVNAVRETEQKLQAFYENVPEWLETSQEVFERLYELEHLSEDWEAYIKQCQKILYGKDAKAAQMLQKECKEALADMDLEIVLEQLLVYFVFTYFCGAVYDGNAAGKIKMAVDSVSIIYQLFAAKWAEQNERLSAEDMQRIVYRYSRELEHSDVNLEIMTDL